MRIGLLKLAVADVLITFIWIISASTLGIGVSHISSALQTEGTAAVLAITTILIFVQVLFFNLVADAMGGASFNPAGTISFYAAGFGDDSLLSIAFRLPAQAAGAIAGIVAVLEFMPSQHKDMVGGPFLKVDLHTGAIAELVLTFFISFVVLIILFKGPNSSLLKTWLITAATVVVIVLGSDYTGPSLNPVNAFGWAYVNNRHNTWEQFYVFWICPFAGAILASWTFRFFFPTVKLKKA